MAETVLRQEEWCEIEMMLYTTICIIVMCPLPLMLHNLSNGRQSVIPHELCLNSHKDSFAAVYLLIERR